MPEWGQGSSRVGPVARSSRPRTVNRRSPFRAIFGNWPLRHYTGGTLGGGAPHSGAEARVNNLKRPFVLVPVLHCSTLGMSLQYVRRATSLKLHLRVARSRGFVQLDPLTILKIHQERAMFRSRVSPLDVSGRLPGAPATRRWANMASAPHIKKLKVLVRTMVYPIHDFNI